MAAHGVGQGQQHARSQAMHAEAAGASRRGGERAGRRAAATWVHRQLRLHPHVSMMPALQRLHLVVSLRAY